MSRLSKQSIRRLCQGDAPMIHPFEPGKVRVNGVSKGLSHASYDASIAHNLVLGRHPGVVIGEWFVDTFGHLERDAPNYPRYWIHWPRAIYANVGALNKLLNACVDLAHRLRDEPRWYALAYTVEDFHMPANVGGDVADKSTFARVFVSAFNTFFDPGFHGNATLELVNHSSERVEYKAGQGVCQFIFTWLDEATEDPYNDSCKYQGQAKGAHGARFEPDSPPQVTTYCVSREQADETVREHGGIAQTLSDGQHVWVPDPPALSPLAEMAQRAARNDTEAMLIEQHRLWALERLRWGSQARLEAARDAAGMGQG